MAQMSGEFIEYGVASAAFQGEEENGDFYVFEPFDYGALLGVVDGLGHGEAAAKAARAAAGLLRERPADSVISLVRYCHEGLRMTRGVVMSIASFNSTDDTMTWLGVGNVEGVFLRDSKTEKSFNEALLPSRGVVGVRLPQLRAAVLSVASGDTLILSTDGIRSGFESNLSLLGSPQQIADRILERDGLETDDALVLVARYKGCKP